MTQTAMNTSSIEYHEGELRIARDTTNPQRLVPDAEDAASILDIGCGAGQTLLAIGARKRRVGIDIDINALEFGRSRAAGPGIQLAAARGENLPFADRSFDFVYSRVALPYMDIPAAVSEMHRVLRPDGRLWLTLHSLAIPAAQFRRGNLKGRVYAAYTIFNGLWFHVSGRTLRLKRGMCESIQTKRGMRVALSRAGFSNIAFQRTRYHFTVTVTR